MLTTQIQHATFILAALPPDPSEHGSLSLLIALRRVLLVRLPNPTGSHLSSIAAEHEFCIRAIRVLGDLISALSPNFNHVSTDPSPVFSFFGTWAGYERGCSALTERQPHNHCL